MAPRRCRSLQEGLGLIGFRVLLLKEPLTRNRSLTPSNPQIPEPETLNLYPTLRLCDWSH